VVLLGALLLLAAGVFWLGGQAAAASAAHYRTAPVCAAGVGPPCRTVLPATVVSWNSTAVGRGNPQRTVVVRLPDGSTQELVVAGGDLFAALQPGLPVQAEAWAGQIIRLSDDADHLLTTINDPTQASYDNPISALLLGGLGIGLMVLGMWLWYARR
jgi:hypothetical protein